MIAGGMGNIREDHVQKDEISVGGKLIVLGGPAMLIGLGGGAVKPRDQARQEFLFRLIGEFSHQLVRQSVRDLEYSVRQLLIKPARKLLAQGVKMLLHVRWRRGQRSFVFRDDIGEDGQIVFGRRGRCCLC
jgi:hypothetical protein